MSAIKASDSELKDPAVQETLSFSLPLLPYYCLMVQSTCSSRIGEQLSTDPFGVGVVQWLVPHFLLVDICAFNTILTFRVQTIYRL